MSNQTQADVHATPLSGAPIDPAPVAVRGSYDATTQYQVLTNEEDQERTNVHYMLPPRFFEILTGGRWNCYSCNLWELDDAGLDYTDPDQLTRAQERKLDRAAELMELRPGSRVLDVGAGWGGPLTYLARRHGIVGHGLMLSTEQLAFARARAAREGASCTFEVCHWADYTSLEPYDAVWTDEVLVHISRLGAFFDKVFELLRPGGVMLNKELHVGHPAFGKNVTRTGQFVNDLFGGTGNYRALAEELVLTNDAGFSVETVEAIAPRHYELTASAWLNGLRVHKEELIALVGKQVYKDYFRYLGLVIGGVGAAMVDFPHFMGHWVQSRRRVQDPRTLLA